MKIKNTSTLQNNIQKLNELIYQKCGFNLTDFFIEEESKKYNACYFQLNKSKILFRTAKITPTKTGQFVTLWKRIFDGPIQPYSMNDAIDFVVINTCMDNHFGQFVFPKSILCTKGIISTDLKEGKRAIRVYPPWDSATSKQAKNTQKWQLEYFLPIDYHKPVNIDLVKKLYLLSS